MRPKVRITCGGRFHPESCRLIVAHERLCGIDGAPPRAGASQGESAEVHISFNSLRCSIPA
jgi:hypothetical protein